MYGLTREFEPTRRGKGVINLKKWADVVYGWPLKKNAQKICENVAVDKKKCLHYI